MRQYFAALWHELSLDHSKDQRTAVMDTLGQVLQKADALLDGSADTAPRKRMKTARDFHQKIAP